jgi:hypothetical protein
MGGIGSRGGKPRGASTTLAVCFKWLRVAETVHPTTIARLIVDLCSLAWCESISCQEKSTAHSSKLVCAIRQGSPCHCETGGLEVTRRLRVAAWQILAVLDHALHCRQYMS